jgi:uncharacterized BrkB/YihY/UPF0761 family membrane protein
MERHITWCDSIDDSFHDRKIRHLILHRQKSHRFHLGAAGSFVILLIWIYYSAIILYLGAEFAKAWTAHFGGVIQPNDYGRGAQTN